MPSSGFTRDFKRLSYPARGILMASGRISQLVSDITMCVTFFTRIPLPYARSARSFADALWAAPVAGALVGLMTGIVVVLGLSVGLTPFICAALGLVASILTTGALHEDGIADVADGFGGGRSPDNIIAIMRDSRIGSYGTLALILSVVLRWSALADIVSSGDALFVVLVCVVVHTASRAILPAFLFTVPSASPTGLSSTVGTIAPGSIAVALFIGAIALLAVGPGFAVVAVGLLALAFFGMKALCFSKIGGQTGDVLGALQQVCEIIILLVVAAAF